MVRVHVLDDERLVRGTVAIGGRHDQCCRVVLFDHGFPFVRIGLLFEMDMRLMMSDSVQEGTLGYLLYRTRSISETKAVTSVLNRHAACACKHTTK